MIKSLGDRPTRPRCAPLWHSRLLSQMPDVQLVLVIGNYAQHYYLSESSRKNFTENVRSWQAFLPKYFPLPHPSPLNFRWQAKNPWFVKAVLPALKERVAAVLG